MRQPFVVQDDQCTPEDFRIVAQWGKSAEDIEREVLPLLRALCEEYSDRVTGCLTGVYRGVLQTTIGLQCTGVLPGGDAGADVLHETFDDDLADIECRFAAVGWRYASVLALPGATTVDDLRLFNHLAVADGFEESDFAQENADAGE